MGVDIWKWLIQKAFYLRCLHKSTSTTVPVILSLVVMPSGKRSSGESRFLIKSHQTIVRLCAAVMWNTSVIDTDFILGTCVVKPDYCRGNDVLGISHSVTHCCSAHVHGIRRESERGGTKQEGDGKMNRKYRGERERNPV